MTLAVINSGISTEVKQIFIMNSGALVPCKAVWVKAIDNRPYQVFKPTIDIEINTTVYNANLQEIVKGILGYEPTYPINVNVTIGSSGIVGQTYTLSGTTPNRIQTKDSIAALQTGTLPANSTVTINNYGYIVGCGGQGGSYGSIGSVTYPTSARGDKWTGGDALNLTCPTIINNYNTIAGGGGGGSGGDGGGGNSIGGGGGAGSDGGVGGYGFGGSQSYGLTGTLTAGGLDTHNQNSAGGALGQNGKYNGQDGSRGVGLAGAYVVGNGFVTWANAGTCLGNVLA